MIGNDATRALDRLLDYAKLGSQGYDEAHECVKTIRTSLLKSAQVNGLVKALEFYADKENWDKGTIRPPSGHYQQWMMAGCDKGNQAREALQQFNAKDIK